MSAAAVMTAPVGTLRTQQTRFSTATALDESVRIVHDGDSTTYTAVDEISMDAATVTLPGAVFTSAGATLQKVSVAGGTTMAGGLAAASLVADRVISNAFEAVDPAADTITITAKTVRLNADVEVTGTLDTANSRAMVIKDKVVQLGAADADGDGEEDADDTTRDGAGLVVPGAPEHLPAGADAALYEHSLRWRLNGGDFDAAGERVAGHLRPMWEFSGGAVGISAPDAANRKATFFFAPHHTGTTASLALYYAIDGSVKMLQSFNAPAAGA